MNYDKKKLLVDKRKSVIDSDLMKVFNQKELAPRLVRRERSVYQASNSLLAAGINKAEAAGVGAIDSNQFDSTAS